MDYQTPGLVRLNKYQFNGKERQLDLGLAWAHYETRFYDAQLGRFLTIDPFGFIYHNFSEYSYAVNNPIRFIDKDGEDPSDRVKAALGLKGKPYVQEQGSLRTANTYEALKNLDCSELVSRVLAADHITNGVPAFNTGALVSLYASPFGKPVVSRD